MLCARSSSPGGPPPAWGTRALRPPRPDTSLLHPRRQQRGRGDPRVELGAAFGFGGRGVGGRIEIQSAAAARGVRELHCGHLWGTSGAALGLNHGYLWGYCMGSNGVKPWTTLGYTVGNTGVKPWAPLRINHRHLWGTPWATLGLNHGHLWGYLHGQHWGYCIGSNGVKPRAFWGTPWAVLGLYHGQHWA